MKPDNILFESTVGSQAYGLSTANSDWDTLGVWLEPTKHVVGLHWDRHNATKTGKDERGDWCYHEFGKWLALVLKGNPTVSELLWMDPIESSSEHVFPRHDRALDMYDMRIWLTGRLRTERHHLLGKVPILHAYGGYAQAQVEKLMRRQDSFSSDTSKRTAKHARHCLRLLIQGRELLSTGKLTVRLSDADKLWLMKAGEEAASGDQDQLLAFFEVWTEQDKALKAAFEESPLPDYPDDKVAEDLLVTVRQAAWELS